MILKIPKTKIQEAIDNYNDFMEVFDKEIHRLVSVNQDKLSEKVKNNTYRHFDEIELMALNTYCDIDHDLATCFSLYYESYELGSLMKKPRYLNFVKFMNSLNLVMNIDYSSDGVYLNEEELWQLDIILSENRHENR